MRFATRRNRHAGPSRGRVADLLYITKYIAIQIIASGNSPKNCCPENSLRTSCPDRKTASCARSRPHFHPEISARRRNPESPLQWHPSAETERLTVRRFSPFQTIRSRKFLHRAENLTRTRGEHILHVHRRIGW